MVREALENATRYFRGWPEASCSAGPLVDRAIPGYNYATAQGVEYEIDLTRPVGSRVRNLRYRGAPLRDDEPLRIALSCHRAAGSAGYSMFRGAKVVYRSGRAIRDLLAEYWGARGRLPEKPDGNWRLLPAAACATGPAFGAFVANSPRVPGRSEPRRSGLQAPPCSMGLRRPGPFDCARHEGCQTLFTSAAAERWPEGGRREETSPKSGTSDGSSSWSRVDLALIAARFAEEANVVAAHRPPPGLLHAIWELTTPIGALRPWCYRTPTGYAAWFTSAAMVTPRLRAVDLETAADLAYPSPRSLQIRFARTFLSSGSSTTSADARAWPVHPRTATWQ
jgi:hypothetical protein